MRVSCIAQLFELKRALRASDFTVVLSEKDEDQLAQAGLGECVYSYRVLTTLHACSVGLPPGNDHCNPRACASSYI